MHQVISYRIQVIGKGMARQSIGSMLNHLIPVAFDELALREI